jgi:hypothetical protein
MKEDLQLDSRQSGMGIFHVGTYEIGKPIDLADQAICVGHEATLKSGSVSVHARITAINGDTFTGEITGFENIDDDAYKGLEAGDIVTFTAGQIHGLVR